MASHSQIVLITGATAGLGRHAALHLARRGHRVLATGRRADALERLREEAAGTGLETLQLDVTDHDSIQAAVAEVDRRTAGHGLDALVNNAGYGQMGPLELVTDDELRRQFDTNVFGLMSVTRAFLPTMRERGRGRIVNVGSMGGRVTFPYGGAYHATKYAVEALNDALRKELRLFGIDVVLIEPGPIRSDFADRAMGSIAHHIAADSPYAPMLARAEEIKTKTDGMSAGPEVVSEAIERAIVARRPRARYLVPFSAKIVVQLFASWLPTRVADWLMLRLMGLGRHAAASAPRLAPSSPS